LLDTHISGGDTGSFNYLVDYMKNYLLPRLKVTGWSPGWYAGFPIFQFYFFPPFLLASTISYLIPLNIALKLVTVLGTFLLPLTAFFSMKLMKFKFPMPIIAALLVLPFLFNQGNSMWGGNIPSTLAGEFSYSLSLSLTVLFFGLLYKGIEENKFHIHNSILFILIASTHIYTMLFAGVSSLFFLIKRDRKQFIQNFKYLFKVYAIAFLLIGFWIVPLLMKMQYRTPFDYTWIIGNLKEIFPDVLLPVFVLAVLGFCKSLRERDKRILFIAFSLLVALFFYKVAILLQITDIRFMPFFQLFPAFIAAYFIFRLMDKTRIKWIIPIIILIVVIVWINKNTTYIAFWIEWNYKGYESKPAWPQFNAITSYLASLPEGRIVHEFSNVHDKFGTVRSFESFPLFAKKPVLEGLNIESAINAPFVFWIQSEISETPTCPLPRMRCSPFNLENATKHLKLFNVNYIVATSEKLKSALRSSAEYTLLKKFDEIEIYKVNNTGRYVELPKYESVLVTTGNWKSISLEWFKNSDITDVPLVFSVSDDRSKVILSDEDLSKITKVPITDNCSVNETVENEEVRIKTSCIGKPLLVKISYFPNWKVEGADKIYFASPAFMIIYPNKEDVRLYYGETDVDYVGKILSIVGVVIVVSCLVSKRVSRFLASI
jgi:uncharacterized membrane protein